MFLFRAGSFAKEAETHMPDIWQAASAAVASGARDGDRLVLDPAIFGAARRISLDFALMERSEQVGMVPASFEWSDIGSWSAVHAASSQDQAGNATRGAVALRDVTHSLVIGDGLPVLAIGLEGFVVVATQQGVFIAPNARAQEIKGLLDSLPAV
jgi:mannose-1-phosphate guanylyltransferase/mannose-6-phosphate isomerase